ncbi:MAG: diacylglycerol/lipid kinase family protein [Acidobacteriota bacterium]
MTEAPARLSKAKNRPTAWLLHNPAARGAPDPTQLSRIARELALAGFRVETAASDRPGAVTGLARHAASEGAERVVVCGGDGTVREAAQGLTHTGVPLGIVPLGTANVLARELGLPLAPGPAAVVASRGAARRVGVGLLNSGPVFTFCASAGLDALAVDRIDLRMKTQTGGWAYVHAALLALLEEAVPSLLLESEEGVRAEASQVFVLRASRYGGDFRLCPEASVFSDTMRVLAVAPPLGARLIPLLIQAMLGGIGTSPGVRSIETRALRITTPHGFPIQADGDVVGRIPAEIRTDPGSLALVVPDPNGGSFP